MSWTAHVSQELHWYCCSIRASVWFWHALCMHVSPRCSYECLISLSVSLGSYNNLPWTVWVNNRPLFLTFVESAVVHGCGSWQGLSWRIAGGTCVFVRQRGGGNECSESSTYPNMRLHPHSSLLPTELTGSVITLGPGFHTWGCVKDRKRQFPRMLLKSRTVTCASKV